MLPTWYLYVLISVLSSHLSLVSSRAASAVNHASPRDGSLINQANPSIPTWPPCPFKITIPKRKGNPYIVITRNDRLPLGPRARSLALTVCAQMTEWLLSLPATAEIKQIHWEHNSYGDHEHAEEWSVWLSLDPQWPFFGGLDREMAYFAMEEVGVLVQTYGAMEGVFEFWMRRTRRAVGTFRVWKWPDGEWEGEGNGNGTVGGLGVRSVRK